MTRALLLAAVLCSAAGVAEDRAAIARTKVTPKLKAMFQDAGVAYPADEVYLRAFKAEGELELWAGAKGKPLSLVQVYAVCAKSGELGPKRREGDLQVPEGFYVLNHFNPYSNFHLSLGVSYPNEADRVLGRKGKLGGAIYIHGNCVTIGCLPIEDANIEEVYVAAEDAHKKGKRAIPIHIFPRRLDEKGLLVSEQDAAGDEPLSSFWRELAPGFRLFEEKRRPPRVTVDKKTGRYSVSAGR